MIAFLFPINSLKFLNIISNQLNFIFVSGKVAEFHHLGTPQIELPLCFHH